MSTEMAPIARHDLLRMKVLDGCAVPAEVDELEAITAASPGLEPGFDPERWSELGTRVRDAVWSECEDLDLADDVMDALEIAEPRGQLREALLAEAGPAPDLGASILSLLGLSDLTAYLRDALLAEAGSIPDVADAVMGELGHGGVGLREALLAEAGPAPDLTDAVMGELGVAPSSLREALLAEAGPAPDVTDAVMAALGLADSWPTASNELADGLADEAGEEPDLWHGVAAMAGIGGDSLGDLLRDALFAEAGAFDFASTVMGAVDEDAELSEEPAAAVEAPVALRLVPAPAAEMARDSVAPVRASRVQRWAMPGMGIAAAAAFLLTLSSPPIDSRDDMAFDLSPVNHTDVEELSSDATAMVLQFEDDAPTIIFIDDVPLEDEMMDDHG